MSRYVIRVDGELSPELASAFPQMHPQVEPVQTVLSGTVTDAAELTGIINHLNTIGVEIVDVVRVPD